MQKRSFSNIAFCILLLILKLNIGTSQLLNNTQVLSIADDIRNHRFASAQQQILDSNQNSQLIAGVVRDVYSKTENNTNLILDFSHDVVTASLSSQILEVLYKEMTANNHSDPLHLIALLRAFKDDVIFKRSNRPYQIPPGTRILLDEIMTNIGTNAKQVIKDALISNSFEGDEYARNVTKELFNFNYQLDVEVMKQLAHETYTEAFAGQLADNMMIGSMYNLQKINFFLALFAELEQNNDLNNLAVQKIAYYLRVLKGHDNYKNVFRSIKYAVNEVIRKMPTCARNLYFARNLCIWNRGRSEYLYAGRSQHNLSRRGIFTYDSIDTTDEGLWSAAGYTRHLGNIYFESFLYHKEYLYASTTDLYDSKTRHVLTWVDDGFVGDTAAWNIELYGDFCFIKNVNFNEYLYTSDRMHAPKKRYVFTAIGESKLEDPDFQWQIRNCGKNIKFPSLVHN